MFIKGTTMTEEELEKIFIDATSDDTFNQKCLDEANKIHNFDNLSDSTYSNGMEDFNQDMECYSAKFDRS
jgi:hypothetical protein